MSKPKCKLIGEDSNIFSLLGKARQSLRLAGKSDQIDEMSSKVYASGSFDEALSIIGDYVEII